MYYTVSHNATRSLHFQNKNTGGKKMKTTEYDTTTTTKKPQAKT